MSKRELIDRIRIFNPTAGSDFLRQFSERQLTRYLGKLVETTPPSRLAALRTAPRPAADTPDHDELRLGAPIDADLHPDPRQLALAF